MQQDLSVSLGDVFRFLRRGLLLGVVLAAIGAGVAYFVSSSRDPVFETQAILQVNLAEEIIIGGVDVPIVTAPALSPSAYADAAEGQDVIGSALTVLGLEVTPARVASLQNRFSVSPEADASLRDSSQLNLELRGPDAEGVAATLNALADALVDYDRQRTASLLNNVIDQRTQAITETQNEIAQATAAGSGPAELARLQNRLDTQLASREAANAGVGAARSRLEFIRRATVPVGPVGPNPEFDAVVAGILGLVLAYGILLLRNLLSTKLRSVDDLANVAGLPVLAEFPKSAKKTRRLPSEASGYLRTNLLLGTQNVHPKVILVTSPSHNEGKSSVALSLAESFTRANYRTLLVDADLRQPVIAREYNLDDKRHMPLRTHLENPLGSYEAAHVGVNLTQTLDIIPTFRAAPFPTELLSNGFPDALASWEKDYDVVVIDSAPLLDVADTLIIAPLCTGTVLVASLENTDPQQLEETVERLQRSGVRIFGIAATFVGRGGSRPNPRDARDGADFEGDRAQPAPTPLQPATANRGRSK